MNVSLSVSGTPSAARAELEKQVRAQGDSNPNARATLRTLQRYVEGCWDDGATTCTASVSCNVYAGNAMPEVPTVTPEGAQNAAPATGAIATGPAPTV